MVLDEQIGVFITPGIIGVEKDESVFKAAQIMKRHEIGSVVVLESLETKTSLSDIVTLNDRQSVIGIVTLKTIVQNVVAKGLDPKEIKAGDIAEEAIVVDATMSLGEAFSIFAEKGDEHLLVEDKEYLIGIFSTKNYFDLEMGRFARHL